MKRILLLAFIALFLMANESGYVSLSKEISDIKYQLNFYARYNNSLDETTISSSTDLKPYTIYQAIDSKDVYFSNNSGMPKKAMAEDDDGTVEITAPESIPDEAIISVPITANVNDFNPADFDKAVLVILDNSTGSTLTIFGLQAPSKNKIIKLYNNGSSQVRLRNQSTNAIAGNRISNPNGNNNFTIGISEYVELLYYVPDAEWKVLTN